ncbi:MAG: deoxyribose-phosphate aldolase [Candidatus Krumholzibacteriia bacterium]
MADARWIEELTRRVVARVLSELPAEPSPAAGWWSVTGETPPPSPGLLADDGRLLRGWIDLGASRMGFCPEACRTPPDLAGFIDHTILKPEANRAEISTLCREAAENRFAAVCVNPVWVTLCAELLRGTTVAVCTVVGFPLGACETEIKALEARRAVQQGATEVDMVIPIGALKGGEFRAVYEDIAAVRRETLGAACLKVIIECALLDDAEKVAACVLSRDAGADYVKTSTGFAKGGATVHDVRLMRRVVGLDLGVKAAGGIRDRATADAMIAAGANRLGASAGVKIISG